MAKLFANSGDPDQTPRSAASDLGLHCLPITLLRVSRIQWVRNINEHTQQMTQSLSSSSLVLLHRQTLLKNIDCGYSLEPPRRGYSNKYLQDMCRA